MVGGAPGRLPRAATGTQRRPAHTATRQDGAGVRPFIRFRVVGTSYGDRGLLGDVVDRSERTARLDQVAPSDQSTL